MGSPQVIGEQDSERSGSILSRDPHWSPLSFTTLFLLLVSVVAVALPASPRYMSFPGRDSGVFLYVATRILDGDLPYRDVWDHKSPGIYYLDALGLWLANGSLWGVWGLEVFSWGLAVFSCFWLLHTAFNLRTAALGCLALLSGIVLILQGGSIRADRFVTGTYSGINLTESYAISFQLSALALMFAANRTGHYGWRGVLIGATSGCCFLLRPNLIAIPLSIAVVLGMTSLWQRQWRHLVKVGMSIALGIVMTVGVALAYFAWHGALGNLLDAAFHYNTVYIQKGSYSSLQGILLGFRLLSQSGVIMIVLLGIGFGIALLPRVSRPQQHLVMVLLVAISLELVLSTMSGRNFAHYFLSWLPIAAILVGIFVFGVGIAVEAVSTARLARWNTVITLVAMAIAMLLAPVSSLYHLQYQRNDSANQARSDVAQYITEHTAENDLVLIWGAEASMNVMSSRRSPTLYVYQYPLYLTGYQDSSMVYRFLEDLEINPPRMIIDASASAEAIPPIDAADRASWARERGSGAQVYSPLPEMEQVYDFLHSHYQQTDTVETAGGVIWPVYTLVEEPDRATSHHDIWR